MFFLFGALPIDILKIKHTKKLKEIGKSMYCSEVHGGDRGWALGQRLRTT